MALERAPPTTRTPVHQSQTSRWFESPECPKAPRKRQVAYSPPSTPKRKVRRKALFKPTERLTDFDFAVRLKAAVESNRNKNESDRALRPVNH
ncbi:hypothetical protein M3Y98_01028400 [Aphelenchoides besseyi]|nr:hypothetical protein M3Y98_01028400 [Aphelenchoides besseyi]KAI6209998.1 hypothetical protein M3Y96_00280500 [Aphelenchoides besseyi]